MKVRIEVQSESLHAALWAFFAGFFGFLLYFGVTGLQFKGDPLDRGLFIFLDSIGLSLCILMVAHVAGSGR